MYINEVTKRINSINWDVVGSNISEKEADFGYEFLRRLAIFFKEESIIPRTPSMTNIATLLGDADNEFSISHYCNKETIEFLEKNLYTKKIIEYYIQLSIYAEKNPDVVKYLDVYEPLIRLLERGGMYVLRLNELEVVKIARYPLGNWYERFIQKQPLDIDNL